MAWGVMTYMDIAFILILIISGIIGAVKGFAKQFFSFVSLIIIVVVAGLLCESLGSFLYPVFGKPIESGFVDWVKSKDVDGLFTTAQNWTNTANVEKALSMLGIPALINNLLGATIFPTFASFGESAVLVEVLPPVLAGWTMNTIAFVVITLILGIILFIVKRIVFKLIERPGISGVNRVLGALVSMVYTYAVLSVILMLVSTLLASMGLFTEIQEFLSTQSDLSIKGYLPIFHLMYNYNFIGEFIVKQFLMMKP